MSKHIISTLSADMRYAGWANTNGTNAIAHSVLVKGGAGVASLGKGDPLTREGAITHVSDEDARFLAAHPHFKRHQEGGFVRILNIARDPDTVAQSMEKDQGSRPKNPKDVQDYAEKKGLGKEPGTEFGATTNRK